MGVKAKLIEMCESKGLTQYDMAELCGISRTHYGQIESGDRTGTFKVLKRIKAALNYYDDDLFDEIDGIEAEVWRNSRTGVKAKRGAERRVTRRAGKINGTTGHQSAGKHVLRGPDGGRKEEQKTHNETGRG